MRPTLTPAPPTSIPPTATATSVVPTSVPPTPGLGPKPVALVDGAMVYGDEAGSNLDLVVAGTPFFDFNGDGHKDFFVKYWTRSFHSSLRHQHTDIVLGRATWPAESRISDLDGRVVLQFPEPADQLPGDPVYRLAMTKDVNGDRKDDVVIRVEETQRDTLSAVELRVFLGQAEPPRFIDVANGTPYLRIRQPAPPRTSAEERRVPMPDRLNTADVDGDGAIDLLMGSCGVWGPGRNEASKGQLAIYLAPFPGGLLDVAATTPNAVIYSGDGIDVCTAQTNDVDGDGKADLLFTGKNTRRGQAYHFGALVLGRANWEPVNEVAALVSTRYTSALPDGDVDVSLKDMTGDGKRDVVGRAFRYVAPKWDEAVMCVWASGASQPAELTTAACDVRFTGKWPDEAADLNGDGKLDFIFPMDQRGVEPHVWRIALGPIPPGAAMEVDDAPDSGDYVLSVPHRLERFALRFANVAGSRDLDLVHMQPERRFKLPEDGFITLHFGPLIPPPDAPAPTATTEPVVTPPTPTATPELPPTVPAPTATPELPPTVPAPTATPRVGWTVFLPICRSLEGDDVPGR